MEDYQQGTAVHGIKWTCSNGNSSTGFSVEQLVQQILDSHQTKPQPRTHNCLCTGTLGAGSTVHHKCNSAKHRIISPKVEPRGGGAGGYSSSHSEVQNNDVSEGKNEHSHGGTATASGGGGAKGGGAREKRNGKVPKPVLLHQNSTEVSSTNQVEVPDTTQNSPVSISSGLNSDPDMADSPVVTAMGHVASVMGGLSQGTAVFMSEVTGDPVYSMSPTGGPNQHLISSDAAAQGMVLGVSSDSHKFAFPTAGGAADAGLAMLSEELVLSSSLDSGVPKIPETAMNFDPDCFLNNPKQGQTYGGSGLKGDGSVDSNGDGGMGSCNGILRRSSLPPSDSSPSYGFSGAMVKMEIKTEDTSFEQQLAKEGGYQVGCAVGGGGGVRGSSGQGSSTLAPGGSLLPSGGGLSPSTTLEQMDFSAIDSKQDYSSSGVGAAGGYAQAVHSPHLAHQSRSPSFFLQEAPQQPSQQQQQQQQQSNQKSHLHLDQQQQQNSHGSTGLSESGGNGIFLGLHVVKTESLNGQPQHTPPNCNGGPAPQDHSPGQPSPLQLLQYQGGFQGLGPEHQEVVGLEQGQVGGQAENGGGGGTEGLLKPVDHLQACGGGGGGGGGGPEHYLQQQQQGSENGTGVLSNGVATSISNGTGPHPQLQPILQGGAAGQLVQGLYGTVGGHHQGGMEISLDHFDISFGNQFSDLINDFISVEGGGGGGGGPAVGPGAALYAHQLVQTGPDGQPQGGPQGEEAAGRSAYVQAELCLPPCCSPGDGGGAGGGPGAGAGGEAGSLAYMHVSEVVSAAVVAQGALGMLQATGRLFIVTDYSPEWSYPEGGVKVLITGPWQEASSNYSCLFDQISVPASLIQPGVLRCYCPAHDTGLVTLQVAISNQIISNSVVFEYKARALPTLPSSQHDWLSLDVRIKVKKRLLLLSDSAENSSPLHQQGAGGPAGGGGGGAGGNTSQAQCVSGPGQAGTSFESRVVVVCEKMMGRTCWAKSKHLIHSKTFRGMTLLHLAAAQGYGTLIQTLIKWRTKHADSIDLELEVDPLNVDHFSCTPLMWACALGHMEAAVVLYKWDRRALSIPDSLGRLPLSIARSRGHTKLAECLEQLQRDEQQTPHLPPAPRMHFSPGSEAADESWMSSWSSAGAGAVTASETQKGSMSNPNPDLRRPRSEPSSYYSTECQRDLPLAKKHKPNPELLQTRPNKAMSVPLSLEQHQLRRHSDGNNSTNSGSGGSGMTWSSKDFYSHGGAGRKGGGGGGGGGEGGGAGGGSGLGSEKLAGRLRQREPINMLMMSEREMVDSELLSYRENLENEDCLTHMDDLQVLGWAGLGWAGLY
ncbi:UNVERIFIED_CONTAM: hypothetical protein FKN15_002162 [Acipenser sinensis]